MREATSGHESAERRRQRRPPARSCLPTSRPSPSSSTRRTADATIRADFLDAACLDRQEIRRSEDFLVDRLFRAGGAARRTADERRLSARLSRREPRALRARPKNVRGRLPSFVNVRSLRVAGGLGTIPRVVSDAANIYKGPLAVEEALSRIERIYRPYHDTLRRLLAQTHVAFGIAVLVDCHSMPSNIRGASSRVRPDFVLGDRFGASCMPELTDRASSALQALGYTVCRNKPYAGGFITEHYGRPARGLHALQIEVNRALYMDEYNLRAACRLWPAVERPRRARPLAPRLRRGSEHAPRGGGVGAADKKGRGMPRPKSREETPNGAAIRVSQCTIYAALHKWQVISDDCANFSTTSRWEQDTQGSGAALHEGVEGDPELVANLVALHQDFVPRARECEDAPRSSGAARDSPRPDC